MADPAHVLDASALLCLLFEEPGAERVEAALGSACIGAVNLAEVVGKLVDRGVAPGEAVADLRGIDLEVIDFDRAQAEAAGTLRAATRAAGLSLGDRACLALAETLGATALTTDRPWAGLDCGVAVEVVR